MDRRELGGALMDANLFNRNISTRSPEELAPFREKHVAWSEDGTRILAAADSEPDLYKEIERLGLTRYVVGYVPDDASSL
jgi:hypothetical protein